MPGKGGKIGESMTQDALLKLLEADARLSDQQIADRLGVDVATVAAKRAALEKAGRIVGYQAIVNDDEEGVSAFTLTIYERGLFLLIEDIIDNSSGS